MNRPRSALETFDRIYVINLDRRSDRWHSVSEEIEKLHLKGQVTRVSAVDAPGAAGCFSSHLKVMDLALQDGAKCPLILEDDALSSLGNPDALEHGLRELPKEWDVLYLGYSIDPSSAEAEAMRFYSPHLLSFPKGCYTTHAYSVHPGSLRRIRQDLDSLWHSTLATKGCMDLQIDLAFVSLSHRYEMFGLYPMVLTQKDGYSDIWKEERKYHLPENIDRVLSTFRRQRPG